MIRKRAVTALIGAASAVALGVAVAPSASANTVNLSLNCGTWGSGSATVETFGSGGEFTLSSTVLAPQDVPAGIPVSLTSSAGTFTSTTLFAATGTPVKFDDFSGPSVTSATVNNTHDFTISPPGVPAVNCDVVTGGTITWP
ncbi:MAG TPA: hypothetical protein VLH10_13205 [Yinghuangia sp.]|uniref:hypothetical protein n=1 Tax=Yinghuangia sp. YIM S10712 TaxID=3436930 RepID=UPI002BFC2C91|nr:hypothetical protein [Yinghuangia sp.]